MRVVDLSGKRFGRLTVTKLVSRNKHGHLVWICKCDCGKICEKEGNNIKTGNTKSCGCLNIEKIIQRRSLSQPWLASFNYLVRNYKSRAKRKGLVFELSNEECLSLFKGNCYYCGVDPLNTANVYRKKDGSSNRTDIMNPATAGFTYNGIDRINNDMGYISDNCNSCCKTCNYTKINILLDEWLCWMSRIAEYKNSSSVASSEATISVPLRQKISKNKLISSYRDTAKRRDLKFLLSEEACVRLFKSNCNYCGVEPYAKINPYLLKNGELSRLGRKQNFTFDPSEATFLFNVLIGLTQTLDILFNNVSLAVRSAIL
jgi:hypothetical protein